ncbi:hypothetical protein GGR10_000534 [Bartonella chomelii]|uniref:Uncharacterized protein n=1 Tax=Bartonella chomelii TaxID=236402 RepID=A0ABR6E2B8_9HYPH|nr:hypothetical protein [Bartonella chomelii]
MRCAGREVCAGLIKEHGLRCGVGDKLCVLCWVSVRGRDIEGEDRGERGSVRGRSR